MVRRMLLPVLSIGLVAVAAAQTPAPAEPIDAAMNAKIRAEGLQRSQVMRIVHVLTDVYGPRLTGTPALEGAGRWAVKEMESWGLKGRLEPWNWGHEGWVNEKASGHIVSPVKDNLVFEVLAWTPSTKGAVTAPAVNLVTPRGPEVPPNPAAAEAAATGRGGRGRGAQGPTFLGPTEAELNAYFATMAPKVKGAIVLVGASRVPRFEEQPPAKRRDDTATRNNYNPDPSVPAGNRGGGNRGGGNRGGGGGAGAGGRAGATPDPTQPVRLSDNQVNQRVAAFLKASGAAIRIDDAYRQHGQIIAFSPGTAEGLVSADRYDSTKTIPTVKLRNEDYGRIARLLADGTPVTLEFNIVNKVFPEGKTSHNAIAEIVGTDKADEVVMLGGHLDGWHSATGATDNAIGCAIMIEAVRILQAVGAKPRRTIRVALWGGEEQGLLGSRAYVAEHFGNAETPKPAFHKLSAYWNIDTGTGSVRGANVFGPPEAAQVLAQLMKPWEEFKIYGASSSTSRSGGGTDSSSFSNAGLPGIGTSQDPIEYNSHTHHTNLDTYERIVPDDVMKNAVITASIIYHLATRDALLPRFTKEQMPAPGGGRGGGGF
jgi:acetylornithine deacetylase/succinyl-diaminopimelate desuccinylase-like protein